MDQGRSTTGGRATTWLARAAFAAAAAAIGLLVGVAGLRGIGLLAVGAAGAATGVAGLWWFLARRGLRRLAAAAVTIAAPVTVVTLYVQAGLLWLVLTCGALSIAAAAAGGAALWRTGRAEDARGSGVSPPRHPFLIMNPRSGGGKVQRCDLARKARALGAEVVLLDEAGTADVAALARRAVRAGADLLGVAGGDGTQAAVAAVAVDNDLPFLVIPAGTRNHFAMDLGLDRADPASCLDALTNGVEIRTDVGLVNDRMFVNNASFGVYAALVQSPAYRDDKAGTALELLPDLLTAGHDPPLRLRAGQTLVSGPQAILVSNNPYAVNDVIGTGRRERLTDGVLGVLAVSANSASDAVRLMRGDRSKGLTRCTTDEAVVDADTPWIPAGVDGEPARLSTPVRCRIRPGALRVRVPRNRPGRRPRPPLDWRRLGRLAFPASRGRP
ncbi:diacylglycerol/lipid kinase family protein [Dactylosporangium sp. NPDC048998]|uniref:diacylglycerol/lipid kinase family protein n=1 Tax=Dactylosporangium sp. NPDC048998 TaxID=3363976 RepID=UPI003720136E